MAVITLTRGMVALIDDEDLELVLGRATAWKAVRSRLKNFPDQFYAQCWQKKGEPYFSMHRLIMNAQRGWVVDHINGDGLDNRRSNLRLVTYSQNAANRRARAGGTSRFKGVTWHKQSKKWQAVIRVNGRPMYLGVFADESDAAAAYNKAAIEGFGECALINKALT